MSTTPKINLYSTKPHPCSYLDNREASTLFIDPQYPITAALYSRLSEQGFRRSGEHIYRPECGLCKACIPLRVPVESFTPSRQQRRVWSKNQDIEIEIAEDISSGEHFKLYEDYILKRHSDGDMFPPNREQYNSFLSSQWNVTHYIEYRIEHKLLGVAVTDTLDNAVSAIYTFFDTHEHNRSLGVYSVLFQIQLAKKLSLPYVYLGYWVMDSPKMSYKSQFQPYEIFVDKQWQLITSE